MKAEITDLIYQAEKLERSLAIIYYKSNDQDEPKIKRILRKTRNRVDRRIDKRGMK